MFEKLNQINESFKSLESLSVSKCIEYLQKPFEQDAIAKKCYDKGFADPNSKYYQMTAQDIIESWNAKGRESCKYGSLLDSYIGMVLNNKVDELQIWKLDNNYDYDSRLKGLCNGFDQFYSNLLNKTDYKYVAREEKVFIKSNESNNIINGRFDCLFYSESLDKYLLIDWKSSGSIDKENKWEKLLGPCYELDACNGNTYAIQTFFYKKALIETYKITTDDKIDTFVCQMSEKINENGNNYFIYSPLIKYNSVLIDKIIDFTFSKHQQLCKKCQ